MQIILWNDAAMGRRMRWTIPMQEREGLGEVDIAAEMNRTLQNASQNYSEDEHG